MDPIVFLSALLGLTAIALSVACVYSYRARERRMRRMTDEVLNAIGLLRSDLATSNLLRAITAPGAPSPNAPTLADVEADLERERRETRERAEADADERSRRRRAAPPAEEPSADRDTDEQTIPREERPSEEEATRVYARSERPPVPPASGAPPFPELTGSQDETPPRGRPVIPPPPPSAGPITPTSPSPGAPPSRKPSTK